MTASPLPPFIADKVTLVAGDCLEVLRTYPDNTFDAVVTDPPYGLSREPDMVALLTAWLAGQPYHHRAAGFMGKDWDSFVPGPDVWREVARVLKPGGHLLCFAGTRTWDLMSLAIRLAGLENRDTIASFGGPPAVAWVQGQGFPKGLDVSKQFDRQARREYVEAAVRLGLPIPDNSRHDWMKAEHSPSDKWWEKFKAVLSPEDWQAIEWEAVARAYRVRRESTVQVAPLSESEYDITTPATPLAAKWSGWNVALKPAWEVILCFRKPLSEPNVAANVAKWGTGALNIDATRVPTTDTGTVRPYEPRSDKTNWRFTTGAVRGPSTPLGRWPPNVLLSHHPACVHVGTKEVKSDQVRPRADRELQARARYRMADKGTKPGYADPSGREVVPAYLCHPDCPVGQLDQSAPASQGGARPAKRGPGASGYHGWPTGTEDGERVEYPGGQVSRFFPQFMPDEDAMASDSDLCRFRYQSKPSKRERNLGCQDLLWALDPSRPSGYRPVSKEEWEDLGHQEERAHQETGKRVVLRARGNVHVTVKARALMAWLVRLVTPPGGVVLDPFAGTGTTGLAALDEGIRAVLIERDPDYILIAQSRLSAWSPVPAKKTKAAKPPVSGKEEHGAPGPIEVGEAEQVPLWEVGRP